MADTVTSRMLRFERDLPAPPATVWQYLVDPELRARWFMGGTTEQRVGGAFEMVMDHDTLSDTPVPTPERYAQYIGHRWQERVTRIDPPRLIAFSWEGGEAGEVTIELAEAAAGTRLTLTHNGLRGPGDATDFGSGWLSHLDALERRLAGRGVPDFWALHAAAEARIAASLDDRR